MSKKMKKAFIVGFCPLTRVIIDVPEDFDGDINSPKGAEIIKAAREKIMSDPANYLFGDNCDRLEEDIECPYKEDEDIEPENIIKEVFEKFTKTRTLNIEDLPEEQFEVPSWTFYFEDKEEAKTLSLETIYDAPYSNDFIFEWKAPGYSEMERLSEMESDKVEYITECLKDLIKTE